MADWAALARRVQQTRARYGMSQADLAERVGVSLRTINNVENGRLQGMRPGTRHKLEEALRWAAGSVHDVLAGGEPTPLELVGGARQSPVPAASRPVLYGLDDEAKGLTEEQIESVRAVIRAMKPPPEDA
jgi:DNA-binding XRE family transcriptional regulator